MSATSMPLPVVFLLCVCLCVATSQVFEDINHIEMSPHPNDLILAFYPCINPIPSKILLGGARDSSIISGGEGHSLAHSCVYVCPCVCAHMQSENHFDWEGGQNPAPEGCVCIPAYIL